MTPRTKKSLPVFTQIRPVAIINGENRPLISEPLLRRFKITAVAGDFVNLQQRICNTGGAVREAGKRLLGERLPRFRISIRTDATIHKVICCNDGTSESVRIGWAPQDPQHGEDETGRTVHDVQLRIAVNHFIGYQLSEPVRVFLQFAAVGELADNGKAVDDRWYTAEPTDPEKSRRVFGTFRIGIYRKSPNKFQCTVDDRGMCGLPCDVIQSGEEQRDAASSFVHTLSERLQTKDIGALKLRNS